jgi:hypothetical protein
MERSFNCSLMSVGPHSISNATLRARMDGAAGTNNTTDMYAGAGFIAKLQPAARSGWVLVDTVS